MLFFQVTLFAGYAYAHGIVRFLPTTAQVGLHTIVLAVACVLLPIIPAETWKGRDAEDPGEERRRLRVASSRCRSSKRRAKATARVTAEEYRAMA